MLDPCCRVCVVGCGGEGSEAGSFSRLLLERARPDRIAVCPVRIDVGGGRCCVDSDIGLTLDIISF